MGLLPFTFVYAYVGSAGAQAAAGGMDSLQVAINATGLAVTVGLTWKLSKVAQRALDSAQGGTPDEQKQGKTS